MTNQERNPKMFNVIQIIRGKVFTTFGLTAVEAVLMERQFHLRARREGWTIGQKYDVELVEVK